MAHVEVSKLTPQELAQLSCTYAALILHDDGQDITGEKIGNLIKAAGVKIEAYWPKLFAKALVGKDIASFFNFGGQVSSAPTATAPAVTAPVAEKKDDKKDDKKADKGKKQQKKEEAPAPVEEEEGMGDLFG